MSIFIMVNILMVVCVFILLMMRHINNNIDGILDIIETQTKTLGLLGKRGKYHEEVLTFVTESVKTSTEFVWIHGTDEDRQEIKEIITRFNEKNG